MSSAVDTRTLVAVLASLVTAISSGTAQATPINNQIANDTNLTAQEKAILTMISTATVNASPANVAHGSF